MRFTTALATVSSLTTALIAFGGKPASAQPFADHLKCYKVKDDPAAKATYTADLGGLVAEPGCVIRVPAKIACIPATKTNVAPLPPGGGGTGQPNAFFCYKVKCPKAALPPLTGSDQFGTRTVTLSAPKLLCAPIAPATTTTTTTSTTTTTLASGCFTDTGDGTIHDTCTGLQWEKKDTVAGSGANPADLHDVDNTYTWAGVCDGDGTLCQPNAAAAATCAAGSEGGTVGCSVCTVGTCNVNPGITTVWDWLNQVNAANFAGHGDWRLPRQGACNSCLQVSPTYAYCSSCDPHELETILVTPKPCGTNPCIASIFGPTESFGYWSASSSTTCGPIYAWQVDFGDNGFNVGCQGKTAIYYARAVR